jgi:hypothetical protein
MADLGYLQDAVILVGNIYSHSSTISSGTYFSRTLPIPILRGTIQGDTLSPYVFIIFLEPLLRWFQIGKHGYPFQTSKSIVSSAVYVDDLVVLSNKLPSLQIQLNKINKFCEWTGMDHWILESPNVPLLVAQTNPNSTFKYSKPYFKHNIPPIKMHPFPSFTNMNHIHILAYN